MKKNQEKRLKKQPVYKEGREALENFEKAMKGLFLLPKTTSKKKGKD